MSLRPLSLPLPQPENIIGQDEVFFLEKLIKIDAGQYKDYCIGWSSEGMDIPERLHIGKYENGMFVFNFSINCGIHSDIGNKTFIEGHKFYYGEAFHDTESYGISLHKLSKDRQALDKLMSISKDIPHYYDPYILFGVEGDYNWDIIEGIG